MAGRTRTTKKLAQRIDLNYFKRLYTIPRWRRVLSIGLTALGLLWLAWGRQTAFTAGPLAQKHALFTSNCAACHSNAQKVTDQACLTCHDGPVHQVKQTFTPACTECHVEHQGAFRLANTRDASCTQCHANATPKVTNFNSGHPEFRARTDSGTVKLNHEAHLKQDLRGPHGPVQLKCVSCHASDGSYMKPVNYETHCAECHPLVFDRRFAEPVPHKKLEIVREFAARKFTEYIAMHPEEVHMADPADPRILRPPLPPARNAAEWVSRRIADTEQLMLRKTCKECHTLNNAEVVPSAIRARWMNHAWFDHDAHQMVTCTECHGSATNSRETADVLLPGIQTCQTCHRADRAESRCFECHVYHDWSKERKVEGNALSILGRK